MSYCAECGQGIAAVPYRCRHCDQLMCPEHRLMEKHTCVDVPKARSTATKVRR